MPDRLLILGVDPGRTGAFACLTDDGELLWVEDAPDPHTGHMVASILRLEAFDVHGYAIVERAQTMRGQGIASSGDYMRDYGIILGALGALGIPHETVPPGTWKRQLGLTKKPKSASRAMAQQLWPKSAHLFERIRDDGRAEAALIGLWYLRRAGKAAA